MNLVAIVLAAGAGRRFGGNKLSAILDGRPLIAHAIAAARAAPVDRVIVVCPPGFNIGDWTGTPAVETVPLDSSALSASLKAGVAASGSVDGAFVFLGDMPRIPHDLAAQLVDALGDNFAAIPRDASGFGHPVLLSSCAFAEIATLEGDAGAGKLIRQRSDIAVVDVATSAIHLDVDRREDLDNLSGDDLLR